MSEARQVALRFVDRINAHDVPGLHALLAEGHAFVDAAGARHPGRDQMRAGWAQFFADFHDDRIDVQEIIEIDETVVLLAEASGAFGGAP